MWLAFGTQSWDLRDGEVLVGSGADAIWRVATADLMPRHFTITVHGLNASLRQSSKDNVVVVNDKQLLGTAHLLNDGDVILAGSGRFVFSDGAPTLAPFEPTIATGFLIEDLARRAHALTNRSTTIGRDSTNSIVVRDPTASRFHGEIRREAGGFALHSMGSSGTLLNGGRLAGPRMLAEGDVIEIAFTKFIFAATPPAGVTVVAPNDREFEAILRNPTLATGRISLIPASRGPGTMAIIIIGLVVVAVVVAVAMYR